MWRGSRWTLPAYPPSWSVSASAQELASELGLTIHSYSDQEQRDEELESAVSIAQALKLAKLLDTDLLTLLGETEIPVKMPIARERSALNAQLGNSAEARELMEDTLTSSRALKRAGIPSARRRRPAARMIFAALTFRSWTVPYAPQVHTLIPSPPIPLGPLRQPPPDRILF